MPTILATPKNQVGEESKLCLCILNTHCCLFFSAHFRLCDVAQPSDRLYWAEAFRQMFVESHRDGRDDLLFFVRLKVCFSVCKYTQASPRHVTTGISYCSNITGTLAVRGTRQYD